MRHVLVLAVCLACSVASGLAQHPLSDLIDTTFNAKVTQVSDGDTFQVVPAGENRAIGIRIFGIDTPERGEPFSTQARNRTRVLAYDKSVTLTGVTIDRYGRLVARVQVGATDLALDLLSNGLACHYQQYSDDEKQALAEAAARAAGVGFWAAGAPKPRCSRISSDGPIAKSEARFVGNSRSRVFHALTCRNAGCKNCVRRFATEEEATAAGFRPAGDCLKGRQ